jgi:hypothetical protein
VEPKRAASVGSNHLGKALCKNLALTCRILAEEASERELEADDVPHPG